MKSKLPVGIIVLGRMGQIYARHLAAMSEVQIVGVADIIEAQAKSFAAEFGAKTWSTEYQAVLNDKDIKAVFVISPTSTHAEIIIAAAEAGKTI